MAIVTHNTIVTNLRAIATAHRQIHNFGVGHISEIASSGTTDYAQMWVEPKDITYSVGKVSRNYDIYILDRCFKDQNNVDEVISDMEQIAQDVIAQLDTPQSYEFYIEKGTTFNLQPLYPDWGDEEVGGVVFTIPISYKWNRDRCAIPFDGTVVISGSNDEVGYILDSSGTIIGTVPLGGTYTVSTLSGTIDVYLDGVLNQSVNTSDFSTETINISI